LLSAPMRLIKPPVIARPILVDNESTQTFIVLKRLMLPISLQASGILA
jgi:hypothetical protein